jgi:uncharacterized protein (TIGR02145 family)
MRNPKSEIMKTLLLFSALLLAIVLPLSAQVSISTDGSEAHSSAMLDVKSTSRGFLPPRMTKAQRDLIADPADGLIIYCTDCSNSGNLQLYHHEQWHSQNFNGFPVASEVGQTGFPAVSSTLTGTYVYSDPDNDPQAGSVFKWYRADNASGSTETLIDGASSATYIIPDADTGRFIRFSVTPAAQSGDSPGAEVKSATFTGPVRSCGFILTDSRDAKSYHTLQIGNQCWMKENLNYGTRVNGLQDQPNNAVAEKYCYNDLESGCAIYGGLYQWAEMMNYSTASNSIPSGRQGVCPPGWHIPSDAEWCILMVFLDATVGCDESPAGTDIGGRLKEEGITHWLNPNTGATNSSNFTALPGGIRNYFFPVFSSLGTGAGFWSARATESNGWLWGLNNSTASVTHGQGAKSFGMSVRCIKDCSSQPTQSDAGPDQLQIQGVSTTLQGNIPDIGSGTWSIVTGEGGIIAEPLNAGTVFTGYAGHSYVLKWTISSTCGSGSDDAEISFAVQSDCQPFTDARDGKFYHTMLIGSQCWMKENLDIGTMLTGGVSQTSNQVIEKWCYDNDENNCAVYGGLYQWDEAMQYTTIPPAQGICPTGWHLPTQVEWINLSNYLGGDNIAGGAMKEAGTDHWAEPNADADNCSGFTGLPGGMCESDGFFYALFSNAMFCTSTEISNNSIWVKGLDSGSGILQQAEGSKGDGNSVRCLKDF